MTWPEPDPEWYETKPARFLIGTGGVLHVCGIPAIPIGVLVAPWLGVAYFVAGFWFWGWATHRSGVFG